jgi:hypothetical protein
VLRLQQRPLPRRRQQHWLALLRECCFSTVEALAALVTLPPLQRSSSCNVGLAGGPTYWSCLGSCGSCAPCSIGR